MCTKVNVNAIACVLALVSAQGVAGDYKLVALTGASAPNAPDAKFASLGMPIINDVGRVAFTAQLSGPTVDDGNRDGVWSDRSGPMSMVLRSGQAAPGTAAEFKSIMEGMAFNIHGQMVIRASLAGENVSELNDQGLWFEDVGSLSLLARAGDAAPGTQGLAFTKPVYDYPEGSQTADAFGFPLLNDSGQIAFYGNLPSVGQYQFGNGIWRATENSLDAMAVRGSEVGGVAGAVFTGLGPSPRLNASGQLAFGGGFSGPGVSALNNGGVLIDSNGSSTLVARKGDSAPNLASVQFAGISQPALNDAGEASFYATLSGASVTSLNDRSIWSTAGGGLNLVARSDEVAPGSGGASRAAT